MNSVENKLREALDERAEQTEVDTAPLWYGVNRRIQAREAQRKGRLRFLVPAVGVGTLTVAAAVGVPALLHDPEPLATPAAKPTATATVKHTPTQPPSTPASTPAQSLRSWQHRFTDAPKWAVQEIIGFGHTDNFVPVDFVKAPDGDFLLYATYVGDSQLCWTSRNLTEKTGGGSCTGPELPMKDPYTPSNRWLSSSHMLDYPYYGGDGLDSPLELSFAAGLAAKDVARVSGIDRQGRRHEAKLVGKQQHWPNQQYFFVVEEPTKLVKIEAFDSNGKLLSSIASEDNQSGGN